MKESSFLSRARRYCEESKERLTEPRQKVLSYMHTQSKAVGAYEIIEALSQNNTVNPPTVYRAIDFWIKHGFIHKVEKLNSYIACCHKNQHQHSLIMICNSCKNVTEIALSKLPLDFQNTISKAKFKLNQSTIEITGYCVKC